MSVTPKCLINAKYAGAVDTTEYTAPISTRTIIDKFTATNIDSVARALRVHIVASAGSVANDRIVIKDFSIAANTCQNFTELQNQILNPGDFISAIASVASTIVIRSSGREVT